MKKLLIWGLIALSPGFLLAQQKHILANPANHEEETEDVEDEDNVDIDDVNVREHPQIVDIFESEVIIPSFINIDANKIQMNGANWSRLINALKDTHKKTFSVVHIGDSHVQADIGTGMTRNRMQLQFGDAGRGLIAPLKLSGTNEPADYIFSSTRPWNAVKLMKTPWNYTVGFTGTSINPKDKSSNLILGTASTNDYKPFSSFTIFHRGKFNIDKITDENGRSINFKAIPSKDYTQIFLFQKHTKVTVDFTSNGDLTVFGASLSNDRPGVFYHAIGNNGATYETYNRIGNIGKGIKPLNPNLVIIALGANEAFGRLDTRSLNNSIDKLVQDIRQANPLAEILLVTPMECHKSVYTTKTKQVKVATKKKKKGRNKKKSNYTTKKVSTRVKSYAVNNNILPIRNEILRYAKDNHIAVYDWYEIAGGAGASNTWFNNGYYSSDRVHHTAKGYHLQGELLYEALLNLVNP